MLFSSGHLFITWFSYICFVPSSGSCYAFSLCSFVFQIMLHYSYAEKQMLAQVWIQSPSSVVSIKNSMKYSYDCQLIVIKSHVKCFLFLVNYIPFECLVRPIVACLFLFCLFCSALLCSLEQLTHTHTHRIQLIEINTLPRSNNKNKLMNFLYYGNVGPNSHAEFIVERPFIFHWDGLEHIQLTFVDFWCKHFDY